MLSKIASAGSLALAGEHALQHGAQFLSWHVNNKQRTRCLGSWEHILNDEMLSYRALIYSIWFYCFTIHNFDE